MDTFEPTFVPQNPDRTLSFPQTRSNILTEGLDSNLESGGAIEPELNEPILLNSSSNRLSAEPEDLGILETDRTAETRSIEGTDSLTGVAADKSDTDTLETTANSEVEMDSLTGVTEDELESESGTEENDSIATSTEEDAEIETSENLTNIPEDGLNTDTTDSIETNPTTAEIQNIEFDPNFGIFTVGEDGHLCIDFLHDGGKRKGEVAVFSLAGMEALEPGSAAYIQEAANRALSNSELGHVIISDRTEGTRFDEILGEETQNWNSGEYLGLKHFNLTPGDEVAFLFVPNGKIQNVADNPNVGGAQAPLFSFPTPDPVEGVFVSHFADATGEGNTFAWGDRYGDSDYNDVIFRVLGATGTATAVGEFLDPEMDWRGTEAAETIFGNIAPEGLRFSTETFYGFGETIELLDGAVLDANGIDDLVRVDFELQANDGAWVDIADATEFFSTASCEAGFEYALSGLAVGRYNIRGTAYDADGEVSGEFVRSFTVLPISDLSSRVKYAIERSTNLDRYTDAQLTDSDRWVVNAISASAANAIASSVGATNLGFTGHLPNTFILEFPEGTDAVSQLQANPDTFFFYPLIQVTPEAQADPTSVPSGSANATGNDVIIGVIDDGLDPTVAALADKYRSDLSRDFNDGDDDPIPLPGDTHGTTIAQLVNQIAPDADIAGLRLTADVVEDPDIAAALGHRNQDIDIYNNSWRNTYWFDLPQMEWQLEVGAESGRDGFGNIFVFPGGDGGQTQGNTNYDPFANSRHTIAVTALDANGESLPTSEPGASLVVGVPADSTDSAAAFVSGVTAQMLEVNPTLTWRDIQHILIETADRNDTTDGDWQQNEAGYWINHQYGFGAINAEAAVAMAGDWETVAPEVAVEAKRDFSSQGGQAIPDGESIQTTLTIDEDITIESLEVLLDGLHDFSGDLKLVLTSPDGTQSVLAGPYSEGEPLTPDWTYTSLRHWGESSLGDWMLEVFDTDDNNLTGSLTSWKLNLFGRRPTVTIEATDTYAKEGGNPGAFTITRTGNPKNDLEVTYEVEPIRVFGQELAVAGEDYEELSGSIVIPAGATSVTLSINPIDDDDTEWRQRVDIKITDTAAYEVEADSRDTLLIWDNDTPLVRLYSEEWPYRYQDGYASESGNASILAVRRIGELETELTVNYTLSGTATNGQDYQIPPGSVTFEAASPDDPFSIEGQHDIVLDISPIDDNLVEGDETLIATLDDDPAYLVQEVYRRQEIEIADNDDRPTVSLEITEPTASENGDLGYYTITRDGDTTNPLTVDYFTYDFVSSRAAYNSDPTSVYSRLDGNPFVEQQLWDYTLPGSITIPAGETSARIYVDPIDDTRVELTEYVYLFLKPDPNYSIAPRPSDGGIVSILDNDEPTVEWQAQSTLSTPESDVSQAVTVDGFGNTYIAGRTSGDINGGTNAGLADSFIAKYDSNGNEVWQQSLVATTGFDEATGIAVDGGGNSYTIGSTGNDFWLAKADTNGNLQWQQNLGAFYNLSQGAVTFENNSLYLTGYTLGSLGSANQGEADAFVAKFDLDGNELWVQQVGGSDWEQANGVAVDNVGNVYITGETQGALGTSAGSTDAWVAKFDTNGNPLWNSEVVQLGTQAVDAAKDIAVDDAGNVYLAGLTYGELGDTYEGDLENWTGDYVAWGQARVNNNFSGLGGTYSGNGDAWVAQVNAADGTVNWKRLLGTSQFDEATRIDTDSLGNVYLTGRTRGQLPTDTYAGGDDVWAARYSADGALQWRQALGSTGDDRPADLAVLGTDTLVLAGLTSGDFPDASLGSDDAWVLKLSK